jgi:hypothetical protein
MKNLYYQLWADGIINSASYKRNELGWKNKVFWLITMANSFNIVVIYLLLQRFDIQIYRFEINIFGRSLIKNVLEGFLNFCFPIALINYFMIFKNDKYISIIKRYKDYKGVYAITYTLSSILVLVLTIIVLW